MTYSEGSQYQTIKAWDIFTRPTKNSPWVKLRTSSQDETVLVEEANRRAGWQAYAISQQTRHA